jgi:hypothetical protein
MKITAFWDIAPYSLAKFTNLSEVLTASIIRATHSPDDGGSKHY